MSAQVSFTLVVFAGEPRGRKGENHMSVNVQCWRAGECFQTIDLASRSFTLPAEVDTDVVENWAVAVAREVANALAEVQMSAVEKDILNRRSDWKEPADAE